MNLVANPFAAPIDWQAVAAANPLASEAGRAMLRAGGSAIDAAIAMQMVLTLVEPQSSGIGGGAFILYWDGKRVQAFDGREAAPAAVTEKLFLQADGTPMPFRVAQIGGRSVGVPGVLRALKLAHEQHGKLPWHALFAPAIALARNGFAVSERLHTLLAGDPYIARSPAMARYFLDEQGRPLAVGTILRNPELAQPAWPWLDRGVCVGFAQFLPVCVDVHAQARPNITQSPLADGCQPYRHCLGVDRSGHGGGPLAFNSWQSDLFWKHCLHFLVFQSG